MDFKFAWPTLSGEDDPEEAQAMTSIQFLAFVGAPLILLGVGIAVYLVTGWADRPAGLNRP